MWTLACLDGSWYHFDACWQAADELQRFGFFGMDDEERYQSLSMNNFAGIAQNVSMFCMDWYTSARGAAGMPVRPVRGGQEQMYAHVYGAYPLTGKKQRVSAPVFHIFLCKAQVKQRWTKPLYGCGMS